MSIWGCPMVNGPLRDVGFWKFNSSESTAYTFSWSAGQRVEGRRTVNERRGRRAGLFHCFVLVDMCLSLGEPQGFVRLAVQRCLSIELLGALLRKRDSLLRIVASVLMDICGILCRKTMRHLDPSVPSKSLPSSKSIS